MQKKYIVRLTDEQRKTLRDEMKSLSGSPQRRRRAQILLKADANGPNWTDKRIAEIFSCRTKTVENVRQRFVIEGFDVALHGTRPGKAPRGRRLNDAQLAQLIALRASTPPKGVANWSLRLLAEKMVELKIADSISYETVRKALKEVE